MKRKKLPTTLTASEIYRLINAPDSETAKGKRDRAILSLILSSGLWVSDLIALATGDVFLDLSCIRMNGELVPIKNYACEDLKAYFAVRGEFAVCDAFFVNLSKGSLGQALTRQGVWKIIKSYQQKALIDKEISPEMLRQSFAVDFLERGGDLGTLQRILGHKYLKSTNRFKK